MNYCKCSYYVYIPHAFTNVGRMINEKNMCFFTLCLIKRIAKKKKKEEEEEEERIEIKSLSYLFN